MANEIQKGEIKMITRDGNIAFRLAAMQQMEQAKRNATADYNSRISVRSLVTQVTTDFTHTEKIVPWYALKAELDAFCV